MAKKKQAEKADKKPERFEERPSFLSTLRDETVQGIFAVLWFTLAVFTSLAIWGGGAAGHYTFKGLSYLLGVGYYLLPLIFFILGILTLRNIHNKFSALKLYGSLAFLLFTLAIIDIVSPNSGGVLGKGIAWPFMKVSDMTVSLVLLSALVIVSVLVAFNEEINIKSLLDFNKEKDSQGDDLEDDEEATNLKLNLPAEEEDEAPRKIIKKEKVTAPEEKPKPVKEAKIKLAASEDDGKDFIKSSKGKDDDKEYTPPPLSLLERDKGKPVVGDVKANANIIKRTLMNFGIDVEMDEVSIGPSVTRYALKPAEGVKLSRIVALQDNLALALAASSIRIEAPIPGKSLVGIEIPNTTKTMIGLGSLFSNEEFQTSEKPLLVGLGKGISGKAHFQNVAKMPHLLIAGATGSGKSVTIHALIVSLLYRNGPQKLKFIMIDPKRVELTLYNKIPHLLTPVITDAKKAILSLKWAAKEMDRRYDVLQSHGVRDLDSYHKNIYEPSLKKIKVKKDGEEFEERGPEPLPYIVVIIDELADIMQTYPRELEAGIVRLAQMSRAVGIHLMLSTQRPSVNVITGLIKANIPSRLALQVASQIDSRTILDQPGAEKLLGQGDMLYLGGEMSKPTRIQCAYISESEVKEVVKYLISSHMDDLSNDTINLSENATKDPNAIFSSSLDEPGGAGDDDDDMYEDAKRVVMEAGKASTSYIQRKLRIGYSRAARLMDLLEERGVIGPADGAKPRSVVGGGSPSASPESDMDADGDNSSNPL